jgi:DNA-binding protein H-NS
VKRHREDTHSELRELLARLRPKQEQVVTSRRRKQGARVHDVTPDIAKLRKHATSWMAAHGKAHTNFTALAAVTQGPRLRGAAKTTSSAIVQLRHRAAVLAHPAHPPKHVLVSLDTGKIVGEQG